MVPSAKQASFHCRFVCEWHLIYYFSVLTEAACENKWSEDACSVDDVCKDLTKRDNCRKSCGGCPDGNIDTTTMFLGD